MPEENQNIAESAVQFTKLLVSNLVDDQDAVEVSYEEGENDLLQINVKVAPDESGRVIGRKGRNIKSIRTLLKAHVSHLGSNQYVEVELLDD
jgi:predicted RNA-binding protein YlqC (UPF0109 family)